MSEQFIPTSVWEGSRQFEYGVFELMPADTIHDMMKDIFSKNSKMENHYIVDPFSFRITFAFRNSYYPESDAYKYRITIANEKMRINMDPRTL